MTCTDRQYNLLLLQAARMQCLTVSETDRDEMIKALSAAGMMRMTDEPAWKYAARARMYLGSRIKYDGSSLAVD